MVRLCNSRIYVGLDRIHDCITQPCGQLIEFKGIMYDSDNKRVVFKLKKCVRCGKYLLVIVNTGIGGFVSIDIYLKRSKKRKIIGR